MGKNQHFVPQFYLRFFSSDNAGKCINLYNKKLKIHIPNASLKHQASRNYFYDKDGSIETRLAQVESELSTKIRRILIKKHEQIDFDDNMWLLFFMVLTYLRTAKRADDVEQAVDKFVKILSVPSMPEDVKKHIESVRIKINNAGSFNLNNISSIYESVLDLKIVALTNETDINFIMSDNPLVIYNSYLERKRYQRSLNGFGLKGVQLILPLSPRKLIFAYDGEIYKINNKIFSTGIRNKNDVRALNNLQLVNSDENIYSNRKVALDDTIKYRSKAAGKVVNSDVAVAKRLKGMDDEGELFEVCNDYINRTPGEKELLIISSGGLRLNFGVTFFSIKSNAKKNKLENFPIRPSCNYNRNEHFKS